MLKTDLRQDLSLIASLIPPHSKVLDIGCGDGTLLEYLVEQKQVDGRGIELSQLGVTRSVQRGLSVIQGDADTDLIHYPDQSFDFVISSQVIQATKNPKLVLQESLRIGKQLVLSLPNFGYWKTRWYLFYRGKMPVTKSLSYQWWETPNIHFCTVKDFIFLCQEVNCHIKEQQFIGPDQRPLASVLAQLSPNFFAEQAVFLLSKNL